MMTDTKKREYKKGTMASAAPPVHYADRVPPQAVDVERSILGSMLIDGAAVDVALEHLNEECFYTDAHKKIFVCMRELSEKNTPVDINLLSTKLHDKGWMEEVGTEAYLAELAQRVVTSGSIEYYAEVVKEKAMLRQLITAAGEITTDCFNGDIEPQKVLGMAEERIFGISQERVRGGFESTGEMMGRVLEEMFGYQRGKVSGVPTGFTKLDELTTGMKNGDLVIIGGRPSMGKTAFCLAIAIHAALREKVPTAVFSLEMTKSQILQRMLCSEGLIDMHKMRRGYLSNIERAKIRDLAQVFSEAPLFVDDTSGITPVELRSKARRLKSQHNLGLIIVDYLGLMEPAGRVDSDQQKISQISRALKAVAKELDVPVVVLSQLNRAAESRKAGKSGGGDNRPQLSDLRDSGAIEQDADIVMFVYREEYYRRDDPTVAGLAKIIVAKQRNGPVDDVDIRFDKAYAKFDNLLPDDGGMGTEPPYGGM